jgi:anti-anti-sigma factor
VAALKSQACLDTGRSENTESLKRPSFASGAGWFGKISGVPITLDQSEAQCLICLEGEINIASATEFKQLLVQALTQGKGLRVDLERATELDVTALQLLCAAEREARKLGVAFTVAGRVPEEISAAVIDAGFERFPVSLDSK